MDITGFEQCVRERAYYLWESEGRPVGRHEQHWFLSEAALRAELALATADSIVAEPKIELAPALAKPAAKPKATPALTKPAEKAKAAAAPRKKKPAVAKRLTSNAISTTLQ
jgi:hypothetical protein